MRINPRLLQERTREKGPSGNRKGLVETRGKSHIRRLKDRAR